MVAAAEQLGLEGGETVLESFACRLLQSYTSTCNFFTPVKQVSRAGCLSSTKHALAFQAVLNMHGWRCLLLRASPPTCASCST